MTYKYRNCCGYFHTQNADKCPYTIKVNGTREYTPYVRIVKENVLNVFLAFATEEEKQEIIKRIATYDYRYRLQTY